MELIRGCDVYPVVRGFSSTKPAGETRARAGGVQAAMLGKEREGSWSASVSYGLLRRKNERRRGRWNEWSVVRRAREGAGGGWI